MNECENRSKNSIYLTQLISDIKQLSDRKLITNNIYDKLTNNVNYFKYSDDSYVLPNINNFDKLLYYTQIYLFDNSLSLNFHILFINYFY